MIKSQWYAIMETKEVGKKPVGVTRMNEQLIPGDLPIIEFRKKRAELKSKEVGE